MVGPSATATTWPSGGVVVVYYSTATGDSTTWSSPTLPVTYYRREPIRLRDPEPLRVNREIRRIEEALVRSGWNDVSAAEIALWYLPPRDYGRRAPSESWRPPRPLHGAEPNRRNIRCHPRGRLTARQR